MSDSENSITSLLNFIDLSPTSFHAASNLAELAEAIPFKDEVKLGTSYAVLKEGFLMLIKTNTLHPQKAIILAAHTDSPALKLKPQPEIVKDNLFLLATDVYGGPLITSWLNRDLALAGRVYYEDTQGNLKEELVHLTHLGLTVPQLAIHLENDPKDSPKINPQKHLWALAGLYQESMQGKVLESLLKTKLSLKKLISHDLFLTSSEKAKRIGIDSAFIAAPRLDNLASCHGILEAFNQSKSEHNLQIAVFWDNEEIGSATSTGAESPLFLETLEQVCLTLGMDRKEFLAFKGKSQTFSIDMAHAAHPCYPETMEPNHAPQMGEGVVIKWSTSARYATTGKNALEVIKAAKKAGDNLQNFIVRGDKKGGSTIGPIHASSTGITTADLGVAQLSMHSVREIIAAKDHLAQIKLFTQLYEAH